MNFELFISLKHLRTKRGKSLLSLLTIISVVGVAVGVMTLIVVLAVMNGFQNDLRSKILGITSHIMVFKIGNVINDYDKVIEKVESTEGVRAATPFIQTQVMISGYRAVSGAILRGIDPDTVPRVLNLPSIMKSGSLSDLKHGRQPHLGSTPPIILGIELATNLGIGVGGIVNVISPVGRLTPLGQAPKSQKFIVVGLFESGLYNYDNSLAFINLQSAQKFLGLGNVCNGIEVNVKNVYEAPKIASTLRTVLGHGYFCRDWTQMNKNFFAALKLEKTVMFIILTLIILVASFNIISTLIMVVMEKTRDIAILKAMGATNRMIMKIFVLEGVIIGAIGTILGLVGGFTLCSLLKKYKFIQLPADVYTISTLPVKIESLDVILITIATMLISLLATLYPSWQASRLNPSEALRYG